jgi:hypothetical protein
MTPRTVARFCALATLVVAVEASGQSVPPTPALAPPLTPAPEAPGETVEIDLVPADQPVTTAATILANQPAATVDRLMEKNLVVMQEVREDGSLSGGIITAYVIFADPIDPVYDLLSQSARQIEFRPELTNIEMVAMSEHGPVDEQRLKILFQRFVYYISYRLDRSQYRIEWHLDHGYENDLDQVDGFWELYEMEDGRTLGRSGTSIDVGPAIPAFLQDWLTRKNLPQTMERVRLWVDSGGSYRP